MEELESLLNDLKLLQEDASNTLDNSYSAARKIWESLPENERLLVSPRGNYVDSPNLIKRVVVNGKGFADAYKYDGKDDIAFTVVAISPNCRGQGLSKQLITRLESELKRKGVKKIIHRAEKTNNASIGLAKSLGYQFDGKTKHQVRFSKVLNESIDYYRVTYDGEGIYEALKKKVGYDWNSIKSSPNMNWLPVPPDYANNHRSYFTKKGYDTFTMNTLPLIQKYLDSKKIKVDKVSLDSDPIYKDKYQVVLNEGVIFSDDDYKNNIEDFESGKEKILYVFGLSGSGKTTMTNKLAKLMKCKVIHIDEVHHDMSKKFGKNWKNGSLTKQQRRDIVWNEVKKRAGDDKCIIEGGMHIIKNVPDLESKPYIIPGTSLITSTYRMIKRTLSSDPKQGLPAFKKDYEGKSKFDMIKRMLELIYDCASWNIKLSPILNSYKKN